MPWGCCSGASGFIKAGTLALFIEVPGIEFILVRLGTANKFALLSASAQFGLRPHILVRLGTANKFALLSASTYICNSIRRIQYE